VKFFVCWNSLCEWLDNKRQQLIVPLNINAANVDSIAQAVRVRLFLLTLTTMPVLLTFSGFSHSPGGANAVLLTSYRAAMDRLLILVKFSETRHCRSSTDIILATNNRSLV